MAKEIISLSATEIAFKIRSKELTVTETVLAFLEQIEEFNPVLNAICDLRKKEDILNEAHEKDILVQKGKISGLLFGVPLTVKDSFQVKGLKNSNGTPGLRNYIAEEDAELVKRLKNEGAIIIGKTNVPLFCIDWQSTNRWNGQTNNPFDLDRVAGGSSGGSAVSVASRFSPLELGADAGGSIRVPAHFNGICGLRPTENFLSNRGHLKAPGRPQGRRHIVTPGPFAKNVDDLILMMEVLGNNSKYQLPELPYTDFHQSTWNNEPLRIAFTESINDVLIDEEYLWLFNNFIEKLKSTSHCIIKDQPKYNENKAYVECTKIQGFEIGVNNTKFPLMATFMYLFILIKYRDHLWAKGMSSGLRLSNSKYAKAIDYKDEFSEIYNRFLTKYDIWITPVCCFESYKHQRAGIPFKVNGKKVSYTKAIASYTFTTAFSGHPIVVIPIGKKANGMPVGVQIHSRKWTDKRLLEIAKSLEMYTNEIDIPNIADTIRNKKNKQH